MLLRIAFLYSYCFLLFVFALLLYYSILICSLGNRLTINFNLLFLLNNKPLLYFYSCLT
ncbi:hypothetical protein [Enterococcus phage vB_Efs19_KEN07]